MNADLVNSPSLCPEILRTLRRFPVKNVLRLTCAFMIAFLLAPIANTANTQDQPTIAKD